MPRYRVTFDVEADSPAWAMSCVRIPSNQTALDHVNSTTLSLQAVDDLDTLRAPSPRSIIFYRRATVSADTPGDFLPNTNTCDYELCEQIATVLVSWSDGYEQRSCAGHMADTTGYELVDVREREEAR